MQISRQLHPKSIHGANLSRLAMTPSLPSLPSLTSLFSRNLSSASKMTPEERESKFVVPSYSKQGLRGKQGLVFEKGQGVYLYDAAGNKYIDLASGIAVNVLGHSDEEIAEAVSKQIRTLTHVSNLFHSEPYLNVAQKLIEMSPGFSMAFFSNSGAEANEGALKFAMIHAHATRKSSLQPLRTRLIAMRGSFHGRTLGALAVTYKPAIREPFLPLMHQNVTFVDFNDVEQLTKAMGDDVLAVIMEPVQGESGVNPASLEFIKNARSLCDKYGSLLIFDEVQCGLGRTGYIWSNEPYGIQPDLMTLAKPLAGGLPIGGILVGDRVNREVPKEKWLGMHGTTFGGSPLVCRAAEVVLNRINQPPFMQNARAAGKTLIDGLLKIQKAHPDKLLQVRRPVGDQGLFAGLELPSPAAPVVKACLDNGLVIITAGDTGRIIRICPPLIITPEQIRSALAILEKAIKENVVPSSQQQSSSSATKSITAPKFDFPRKEFKTLDDHRKFLKESYGALPKGFSVGTAQLGFRPVELSGDEKPGAAALPDTHKMNLTLIAADKPVSVHASVFTSNAFPGAPIVVGRRIASDPKSEIAAILVNNRISNVHPRGGGVSDSERLCKEVATQMKLEGSSVVLPSSTGIIGWQLPVNAMLKAIPNCVKSLQNQSIYPAAEGIMTTDHFPKIRSVTLPNNAGRIVGIAKGAGMIEPNLATMLVYILTDAEIPGGRKTAQTALEEAVNAAGSINRITVDSDQSTSDTVVLLSSGAHKTPSNVSEEQALVNFKSGLNAVCAALAEDIVRNGEGVKHVMKVRILNAPSEEFAIGAARAVANSPLVKSAVHGNDPNVGRIIAALGSYMGKFQKPGKRADVDQMAKKVEIKLGTETVFKNSEFALDPSKEERLYQYLKKAEMQAEGKIRYPDHENIVEITIDLNSGNKSTEVIGADLSTEYVKVNCDYRS